MTNDWDSDAESSMRGAGYVGAFLLGLIIGSPIGAALTLLCMAVIGG